MGLALHIYGCRTIQRLFEHCSPSQLCGVVEAVLGAVGRLASDAYGNNVLRHLLEHGGATERRRIIQALTCSAGILELATQKSSSLVLEKCLQVATDSEHAALLEADRKALIAAVLAPSSDPSREAP